MGEVENNISYVIIPFYYEGKKKFKKIEKELLKGQINFSQINFDNDLFLEYVEALLKKTILFKLEDIPENADDSRMILFGTGVGFLVVRYSFPIKTEEQIDQKPQKDIKDQNDIIRGVLDKIKKDNYEPLNTIMNAIPHAIFFPAGGKKNALMYNLLISKIVNSEDYEVLAEYEQQYSIDKMHEIYYSSNKLTIVTDQHLKNLRESKYYKEEQKFREQWEESLLYIFLLLQHERKAYSIYRKQVIDGRKLNKRKINLIKYEIIELLSCYSFTMVTENVDIQNVYSEYRKKLYLSEYESALSELIFRLDNEMEKKKEKKISSISFFITILSVAQLISVVIDLFYFWKDYSFIILK